jgi:hypothetical protein
MELGHIKWSDNKLGWRSVLMSLFSFVRIPSRTSPKGKHRVWPYCGPKSYAAACDTTSPKGKHREAQGWPRFLRPTLGRGADVQSTLKGLCGDATHSGLDLHESTTQGWRHKAPPTLGSEMLPFQGSYKFRKSNSDKPGLKPRPHVLV